MLIVGILKTTGPIEEREREGEGRQRKKKEKKKNHTVI